MAMALVEPAPGNTASLTSMPSTLPPSMSELEPVANIGYGAYAQVLEVRNSKTGERRALKVVEKKPLAVRGMLQQLAREFGVQRGVQHPNIVGALELAEDSTHAYLLLELCEGGSVWKATHGFPGSCVPEKLTACWLRDAACGVAHLHDLGLVHRDVKLENLLLDGVGRVRLSDFGWCAFEADQPAGMCGTPQLAPPEVCRGDSQTSKVDSWSIGACLVQLLTGTALNGPSDAWLPPSTLYSIHAQDLSQALLQHDPRMRLAAKKALEMPFLRAAEGSVVSGHMSLPRPALSPAPPRRRAQSPQAGHQRQSVSPTRRAVSPPPPRLAGSPPAPQQRLTKSKSPPPPQQRQVSPPKRATSPLARQVSPPPQGLVGPWMVAPLEAALSSTGPSSNNSFPLRTAPATTSTSSAQQLSAEVSDAAAGGGLPPRMGLRTPPTGSGASLEVSSEVDALIARSEARKRAAYEASRTHLLVEEHAEEARLAARQAMQYAEQALMVIRAVRQEHDARAVAA